LLVRYLIIASNLYFSNFVLRNVPIHICTTVNMTISYDWLITVYLSSYTYICFFINTFLKRKQIIMTVKCTAPLSTISSCHIWAHFHNTLIRLKFNPIRFMQKYTYFEQWYHDCLKQSIYL